MSEKLGEWVSVEFLIVALHGEDFAAGEHDEHESTEEVDPSAEVKHLLPGLVTVDVVGGHELCHVGGDEAADDAEHVDPGEHGAHVELVGTDVEHL